MCCIHRLNPPPEAATQKGTLTRSFGVGFAGVKRVSPEMQRALMSPRYTARVDELMEVLA